MSRLRSDELLAATTSLKRAFTFFRVSDASRFFNLATDQVNKLFRWLETGAPSALDSFEGVKQRFLAGLGEGGTCPCCGRYGKRYRRKLNAGMSRALLVMSRAEIKNEEGWFFASDFQARGVDLVHMEFHKLRFWNLVEPFPSERVEGRESGFWRITPRGYAFARGEVAVPRHAYEFDGVFLGHPDESDLVFIGESLGDKFDFNELMGVAS